MKVADFTVDFEPLGLRGKCHTKESLLACARRLGVGVNSICGGRGTCHTCMVQVVNGTVSRPTRNEREAFTPQELKHGWRLACQTYPTGNVRLVIPAESMTAPQRVQVEGLEIRAIPEPAVRAYDVRLSAPSLKFPQADGDRLLKELNRQQKLRCTKIDIGALRAIPDQLRSWKWKGQAVVRNRQVVAMLRPKSRQLGLAVDLGTTKVAAYLADLINGRTLAAKGVINPQTSYGEDIINRINRAAASPDDAVQLQKLAVDAINGLCIELCAEGHVNPKRSSNQWWWAIPPCITSSCGCQ
jgi:uncharacterized 2Fe-2S/4Fe-4S cluster protein (DUF4445 family)